VSTYIVRVTDVRKAVYLIEANHADAARLLAGMNKSPVTVNTVETVTVREKKPTKAELREIAKLEKKHAKKPPEKTVKENSPEPAKEDLCEECHLVESSCTCDDIYDSVFDDDDDDDYDEDDEDDDDDDDYCRSHYFGYSGRARYCYNCEADNPKFSKKPSKK